MQRRFTPRKLSVMFSHLRAENRALSEHVCQSTHHAILPHRERVLHLRTLIVRATKCVSAAASADIFSAEFARYNTVRTTVPYVCFCAGSLVVVKRSHSDVVSL